MRSVPILALLGVFLGPRWVLGLAGGLPTVPRVETTGRLLAQLPTETTIPIPKYIFSVIDLEVDFLEDRC